jgi:death-on-curing protein
MDEPVWVLKAVVLALHEEQLAEHGGSPGLRDEGLLDSALDRPRNLYGYGSPDLADLAASYAHAIAKNHAFVDGNKRTSLVVAELFLALNGAELNASDSELVVIWLSLASGEIEEADLARWIRQRMMTA